jgi:hypothetical protein
VLHSSEHTARPPGRGHKVGGAMGHDWLGSGHGYHVCRLAGSQGRLMARFQRLPWPSPS